MNFLRETNEATFLPASFRSDSRLVSLNQTDRERFHLKRFKRLSFRERLDLTSPFTSPLLIGLLLFVIISNSSRSLGEDKCGLEWSVFGLHGSVLWGLEEVATGFHGSATAGAFVCGGPVFNTFEADCTGVHGSTTDEVVILRFEAELLHGSTWNTWKLNRILPRFPSCPPAKLTCGRCGRWGIPQGFNCVSGKAALPKLTSSRSKTWLVFWGGELALKIKKKMIAHILEYAFPVSV